MRTRVIPAQVTTVEDTIAGNLTLTQILLLITPIFMSTVIYALFPHRLAFTTYKIPLIIGLFLTFIILSLRIKGRIILNWLMVLITFSIRPHVYVFNKNTLIARDGIVISSEPKKESVAIKAVKHPKDESALSEFDYESLSRNTNVNFRFTRRGFLIARNYD